MEDEYADEWGKLRALVKVVRIWPRRLLFSRSLSIATLVQCHVAGIMTTGTVLIAIGTRNKRRTVEADECTFSAH